MPPADCAEVRLLLRDPSRLRLDVLVIAFTVYHAVELGHPAEVATSHANGSYEGIHMLMTEAADAVAVKFGIGQCRSLCRSSDVHGSSDADALGSSITEAAD